MVLLFTTSARSSVFIRLPLPFPPRRFPSFLHLLLYSLAFTITALHQTVAKQCQLTRVLYRTTIPGYEYTHTHIRCRMQSFSWECPMKNVARGDSEVEWYRTTFLELHWIIHVRGLINCSEKPRESLRCERRSHTCFACVSNVIIIFAA